MKQLSIDKELSTRKYENITLKLGNVDILSYEHIPYSQALKKVTHLPDCDKRVLGFTSHNEYIVIYPVTWSLLTCTYCIPAITTKVFTNLFSLLQPIYQASKLMSVLYRFMVIQLHIRQGR